MNVFVFVIIHCLLLIINVLRTKNYNIFKFNKKNITLITLIMRNLKNTEVIVSFIAFSRLDFYPYVSLKL